MNRHTHIFAVMDARCGLCAKGASWISRHDKRDLFRIIPMQTPLGQSLLNRHGLDPDDPVSWLVLDGTETYTALEALIFTGTKLGGIWHALAILKLLPKPIRDKLYETVARNRYRLFGTTDMCNLPDPRVQKRLVL